MRILIINWGTVPVATYGGTERVIWDLAYELTLNGHDVAFLTPPGSKCDFAKVLNFDPNLPLLSQIPYGYDIYHFQFQPDFDLDTEFFGRYIFTEHGNYNSKPKRPYNTVFVSNDHANRHSSDTYIHNGLRWERYSKPTFVKKTRRHHFLGKAAWKVKNVAGAIRVAQTSGVEMDVIGGYRLNFRMGFRYTFDRRITFHGMVGGETKDAILDASSGLIMPVVWHEPFGLAVIESLYFGCTVFSTPYGALSEIVIPETGFLSNSCSELSNSVKDFRADPLKCNEHAVENFHSRSMAIKYERAYEKVINGFNLNNTHPTWPGGKRTLLPWTL
jgi:glycosyltransferase involved in cell wall biosynthesis